MSMAEKTADWPPALADYLTREAPKPFSWSSHNCMHFTMGAVFAMTGMKGVANLPECRSALQASAILAMHKGLAEYLDKLLSNFGCEEIPASQATRGDLCIIKTDRGPCAGGGGGGEVFCLGAEHMTAAPKSSITEAWRIPEMNFQN